MKIEQSEFVISSTEVNKCPKPDKPEYAFIGRSNVGKSSLINMLAGHRKLAKISGSPGKTITINHFIINKSWYLVDLPGYGFAKRSKTERNKWEKMIRQYILRRPNLMNLFVLVDLRHEPQKNDLEFMEWLGISQIAFSIIFTKSDKLKKAQVEVNHSKYKEILLENWEELPVNFVTSANTAEGKEDVLEYIDQTNRIFDGYPSSIMS